MVHCPSNSRLLSNLLSSEKDYTLLLTTLLDDTSPGFHTQNNFMAKIMSGMQPPI
jgi:hypothetical protein